MEISTSFDLGNWRGIRLYKIRRFIPSIKKEEEKPAREKKKPTERKHKSVNLIPNPARKIIKKANNKKSEECMQQTKKIDQLSFWSCSYKDDFLFNLKGLLHIVNVANYRILLVALVFHMAGELTDWSLYYFYTCILLSSWLLILSWPEHPNDW